MSRRRMTAAIALITLVLAACAALLVPSIAGAAADPPPPPPRVAPPAPEDGITVRDGFGRSRDDLTYGELNAEIERLEAMAPAEEGTQHMYGLTADGEIGVIGVCHERAVTEEERRSVGDDLPPTVLDCGPAPGVEWPR